MTSRFLPTLSGRELQSRLSSFSVHYQLHPVQTTKACVHGSINMLGLAKRFGIRTLQASTSEVYGDPIVHPQDESYWGNVNPVGVRSCSTKASGAPKLSSLTINANTTSRLG